LWGCFFPAHECIEYNASQRRVKSFYLRRSLDFYIARREADSPENKALPCSPRTMRHRAKGSLQRFGKFEIGEVLNAEHAVLHRFKDGCVAAIQFDVDREIIAALATPKKIDGPP
jgi:hypothetical protein